MVQWSVRAFRPTLAAAILTFLSLAFPGPARADLITFAGDGAGEQVSYSFSGNPGLTGSFAGVLHMTDAFGGSFNAYCVDLNHFMPNSQYSTNPPAGNGAVNNGNAIAYLTDKYVNNPSSTIKYGAANSNEGEASVQLAIWGLLYGSAFNYNGSLLAEMQAFMTEALTSGSTAPAVFLLRDNTTPDTPSNFTGQGVVTPPGAGPVPVPEPSSLLLLGIGVTGLISYRCRRRQAGAQS